MGAVLRFQGLSRHRGRCRNEVGLRNEQTMPNKANSKSGDCIDLLVNVYGVIFDERRLKESCKLISNHI